MLPVTIRDLYEGGRVVVTSFPLQDTNFSAVVAFRRRDGKFPKSCGLHIPGVFVGVA